MNIRADILIRFVLGMLLRCHNKLLHKVVALVVMPSLAHKQRNKLWQVLLIWLVWRIQRTHKIHTHQDSSQRNHKGTLMNCLFDAKVELIKRAFNAVEI
nr:MAG TPA: hypothetical protein [Caudoviricetes sp.]